MRPAINFCGSESSTLMLEQPVERQSQYKGCHAEVPRSPRWIATARYAHESIWSVFSDSGICVVVTEAVHSTAVTCALSSVQWGTAAREHSSDFVYHTGLANVINMYNGLGGVSYHPKRKEEKRHVERDHKQKVSETNDSQRQRATKASYTITCWRTLSRLRRPSRRNEDPLNRVDKIRYSRDKTHYEKHSNDPTFRTTARAAMHSPWQRI